MGLCTPWGLSFCQPHHHLPECCGGAARPSGWPDGAAMAFSGSCLHRAHMHGQWGYRHRLAWPAHPSEEPLQPCPPTGQNHLSWLSQPPSAFVCLEEKPQTGSARGLRGLPTPARHRPWERQNPRGHAHPWGPLGVNPGPSGAEALLCNLERLGLLPGGGCTGVSSLTRGSAGSPRGDVSRPGPT